MSLFDGAITDRSPGRGSLYSRASLRILVSNYLTYSRPILLTNSTQILCNLSTFSVVYPTEIETGGVDQVSRESITN